MAAPEQPQPGNPPAVVRAIRPTSDRDEILLVFAGHIDRQNAPGLADQTRELLEGCGAAVAICDMSMIDRADAATVDLLCRIRLITRRMGLVLEVRAASDDFRELLYLMGLSDVLPARPASGVEPEG